MKKAAKRKTKLTNNKESKTVITINVNSPDSPVKKHRVPN